MCKYTYIYIWLPHPSDIAPHQLNPQALSICDATSSRGSANIRGNLFGAWSGCNCGVAGAHIITGNQSGAICEFMNVCIYKYIHVYIHTSICTYIHI